MPASSQSVPELFERWRGGDAAAMQHLLPLVYDELLRIARNHLRKERADHTLQTTALANEACLRLMQHGFRDVRDRCHFIALLSNSMRQILVDHARARLANKRQGGWRVTLSDEIVAGDSNEIDVLAVDEALGRLAELDSQQARVVELRYFGGLSISETASALDISEATVKREWAIARAWLHRELRVPPLE
jgi:RNA polymerase sigma factor (TIGR02999 family)